MQSRTRSRSLLAFLSLASLAPAQYLIPYGGASANPWPHHAMWPGSVTRVEAAACSTFGYPDVLFQKGDQVFWAVAPAMFDRIIPLPNAPAGVRTFAVVPGAAAGRSSVLLAVEGGLQQWSVDGSVSVWSNGWPEVDVLHRLVGTEPTRVVGAVLGSSTVLVGGAGAAPSRWAVPGRILDVMPIAWDGCGADEIAVATTEGVFIHAGSGALLVAQSYPQVRARLARVRFPGAQALAAAIEIPGAGWFLTAASATWAESSPLPYGVGALSAGDCNGDGYDDLALSRTDSQCLDVVMNLGAIGLPWFPFQAATGFEVQLPLGAAGIAGNTAGAHIGDLDGDGDGDLFHPLHSSPGLIAHGHAPLAAAADTRVRYVGIHAYPGSGPEPDRRSIYVDVLPDSTPRDATDVEVIAWRIDGAGQAAVLQPARLGSRVTSLGAQPGAGAVQTDPFMVANANFYGGSVALCLRFLRRDGEQLVHAWPPRWVLVTLDPATFAQNVQGLPGAVVDPTAIGGVDTDGAIVIPVIPPNPPATPPVLPPT